MHIFPQDRIQMPLVDDDELIEAFLTDRANPAFRVSIGVWSANRWMDYFDVMGGKYLIKDGVNFASRSWSK